MKQCLHLVARENKCRTENHNCFEKKNNNTIYDQPEIQNELVKFYREVYIVITSYPMMQMITIL